MHPATVVLPLSERRPDGVVSQSRSVGRVAGLVGVWQLQRFFDAALYRHGEELRVAARENGARRRKQDRRAIGCEALHDIHTGMPGESGGNATHDRHYIDVNISIVL